MQVASTEDKFGHPEVAVQLTGSKNPVTKYLSLSHTHTHTQWITVTSTHAPVPKPTHNTQAQPPIPSSLILSSNLTCAQVDHGNDFEGACAVKEADEHQTNQNAGQQRSKTGQQEQSLHRTEPNCTHTTVTSYM